MIHLDSAGSMLSCIAAIPYGEAGWGRSANTAEYLISWNDASHAKTGKHVSFVCIKIALDSLDLDLQYIEKLRPGRYADKASKF